MNGKWVPFLLCGSVKHTIWESEFKLVSLSCNDISITRTLIVKWLLKMHTFQQRGFIIKKRSSAELANWGYVVWSDDWALVIALPESLYLKSWGELNAFSICIVWFDSSEHQHFINVIRRDTKTQRLESIVWMSALFIPASWSTLTA